MASFYPSKMAGSTIVYAQKLHGDILLKIAEMNADMFVESKALQITRRTSQVCHQWRDILLGASYIWAKLLDMDTLKPNDIWWTEELLRRSGQSLLWIKAERGIAGIHQLAYLLKIVNENWQRIENITVELKFDGSSLIARAIQTNIKQWLTVTRPAPNLQVFDINFWPSSWLLDKEEAESFMQTPIFSNHAPKLEFFNVKGYQLSSQAQWLKNLSCLKMDNTNTSISEILAILENAQNIHQLVVLSDYDIDITGSTPLPIVSLSKLDHIEVGLPFKTGVTLLDHLNLPRSCSLNFQTPGFKPDEDISKDEIMPYISTLVKFARRYFQSHKPASIEVLYYGYSLEFTDETSPETSEFSVSVSIGQGRDIQEWFKFFGDFLKELSIPELSSVTQFRLNTIEYHDSIPPLFLPLLKCIPSVQVFKTNYGSLPLYLNKAEFENKGSDGEPLVLLPILDTIDLRYPIYNAGVEACVSEFVDFRYTHGKPVESLIIAVTDDDTMPDLASFERFTGLKVRLSKHRDNGAILSMVEHICGSDEPPRTTVPRNGLLNRNDDEDDDEDEDEDEGANEDEVENEDEAGEAKEEEDLEHLDENSLLWLMMVAALHELIHK